ncbi:uracil-DNA glycosylase family protein [Propionivibrio sp.]|uniref:uracil-DNA glycosylase family protein n=1 Tax=Propionivibrio sp. TaxID=2212460 RepID=UPI0025DE57E8|nr:uracil-DNA glycosylase family protein [Propionivibrio sp.]MBK7357063.1 single-stranded DNA-binding protein [Propionivibrio sp.]MBK8401507.1 single-stranded DNA-binding protein [Propionivibrio sp.]MBK8745094.1 single-stranded DNA-binding protein [Propionivibrio sp.]MBK8894083.1 single-stranded DNA-binding protein [Propionivibrio sp.]MBL0208930.1 single-stranded DNA-binding protein [Propionivibrio sp.]
MSETNAACAEALISAARELSSKVESLVFSPPVSHTYNPLTYAWEAHVQYLRRYGASRKEVLFIGMNPGPFGMVQCGVPFGEITAVRGWMGIETRIAKPAIENPKRLIDGFACTRSEVSGRRLWGLFQERFGTAEAFFARHFVANYCPLAFFDQGRNLTPDKLPTTETDPLNSACDDHLRQIVAALEAKWVIAVGGFAERRASDALAGINVRIGKILHPSPASPAANRGWAAAATRQLMALGVWH